jgi:hypothetical protein
MSMKGRDDLKDFGDFLRETYIMNKKSWLA